MGQRKPLIQPFRAVTYDVEHGIDISRVVSLPYDKIRPEQREAYEKASPYSIVKIILPEDAPGDADGKGRHRLAADCFRGWLREGILRRDDVPAIYAYSQEYRWRGEHYERRGFVALLDLDEIAKGGVLPHERTFPEPVADRLALLRTARGNFGQIFLLYDDPDDRIGACVEPFTRRGPDLEARHPPGEVHRVWRIRDPGLPGEINALLDRRDTVIADGHHRFESARCFREEPGAENRALESRRYRMATFVNLRQPGLTILPSHRLVRLDRGEEVPVLSLLEPYFEIREIASETGDVRNLSALLHRLRTSPVRRGTFGLYDGRRYFLLRLREEGVAETLSTSIPAALRELDVTILHELALKRGLGIPPEKEESLLDFVREPEHGIARVNSGEYSILFLLNAVRAEEVLRVARAGLRMPRKSTDFYPKLLSGLLIYDMENP
jgi:uncharacterized protein (DUF1015 family)